MDSDSPDLNFYQKVTKENNAFLLIDCAHDFGHLGARGRGTYIYIKVCGKFKTYKIDQMSFWLELVVNVYQLTSASLELKIKE